MPTRTFYLDKESTEPIIIHHGYNWKNLTITKDGDLIGQVENVKELKRGRSFTFSQDSVLSIQLKQKWGFIQELEILLNGNPIPGSGTDPNIQIRQVYQLLLFIAAFNIVLGFITELTHIEFLKTLGMGYGTMVVGLLNGLFAYLIKFRHSLVALYCAIGLMLLDILFVFVYAADLGGNPVSGLMMKGIFTLVLFNGIGALKKVRSEGSPDLAEHQI